MNEKLINEDHKNGKFEENITIDCVNISNKPTILSRWHNEIIALTAILTLIVTSVLAVITYFSLEDVKKQRDLTYKQFVMEYRPNVNIGFEKGGLRIDDKIGYIDWQVGNSGGDVEDVKFQSILFYIKGDNGNRFSIEELYVINIHQKYLNNDTVKSIHNKIDSSVTLNKIKDIVNMDKRFNIIGLYVRVNYTIPPELTLDGNPMEGERHHISVYDAFEKRFEDVSLEYFDIIKSKLSGEKLNSLGDKG